MCKNVPLGLSIQTGLLHMGLTSSECSMKETFLLMQGLGDEGTTCPSEISSVVIFSPGHVLSLPHCTDTIQRAALSGITRVI